MLLFSRLIHPHCFPYDIVLDGFEFFVLRQWNFRRHLGGIGTQGFILFLVPEVLVLCNILILGEQIDNFVNQIFYVPLEIPVHLLAFCE